MECHIVEGPEIQGSRRMVNFRLEWPGVGGRCEIGSRVRRNEASELRCLTVRDILGVLLGMMKEIRKGHNMWQEKKGGKGEVR